VRESINVSLTRAFIDTLMDVHAGALAQTGAVAGLDDLVMDGIAVALAGAHEAGPTHLAEQAKATVGTAGQGGATLLGRADRVPGVAAARINGAAMHVLDYEPMWNPANHAVSTVLPALLALVEDPPPGAPAIDGRALIAAFAVGIEAQARLRRASGQVEPGDLIFHPPGVVGPLGSAVACGLLLGLGPDALCHALGIAASRAGGVLINVGSMTKALHCGGAAADGLDAALLALRGFTADPDALDGARGYLRAFFGEAVDPAPLTAEAPLAALEPGPAFKFYPSQYGTHFVITAALAARAGLPAEAMPDRVVITCPPMPYVNRPAPASGLAGKFSFQYVAAAAILDGKVDLATFTDARRFAPDMEALLSRIEIRPDATREGRFDRMRVEVTLHLADGGNAEGSCDGPPGIWGRAAPRERLEEKARDCLRAAGLGAQADSLLPRIAAISRTSPDALRTLVRDLGQG